MKIYFTSKFNIISVCFLFVILSGCKKEKENLAVNDILTTGKVEFTNHTYNINGNTLTINTTVSITGDVLIQHYGHCYLNSSDPNTIPTIAGPHTYFGQTNLNNFTISSDIVNYNTSTTYYGRAYIMLSTGTIIYDKTYRLFTKNGV